MTQERVTVFLTTILCIIAIPALLPAFFGGIILPVWTYLLWTSVVVILACVYLVNRCVLIDRFLVKRRFGVFFLLEIFTIIIGCGFMFLSDKFFESFFNGTRDLSEIIDRTTRISQLTTFFFLDLGAVLASLVVAMSDKWRAASFLYNESTKKNDNLEKDMDSLRAEIDALKKQTADSEEIPEYISVKVNLMMTRVKLAEISFVKSDGDYIIIHKDDGESFMTLMTLKSIEKKLPKEKFCRTHRSFIVNVDKVRGMKDGKILIGNDAIPLSDSCKASFFELMSRKSIILKTDHE